MVTGGCKVPGKGVRVFSAKGRMLTGSGWRKVSGTYYYLKSSKALTGWRTKGGYWYHFDAKGRMAVGWKEVDYRYYDDGAGDRRISYKSYFYSNGHCAVGQVRGLAAPKYLYKNSPVSFIWRVGWSRVSGASGYEYRVAEKYASGAWSAPDYAYYDCGSNYAEYGTLQDSYVKIRVRAFKKINGKRAYGPWSTWSKPYGFGDRWTSVA